MSDKNDTNGNSSVEDEFLKKNLPATRKFCPQCNREYTDENIAFCYYDGTRLVLSNQIRPMQSQMQTRMNRFSQSALEFNGFELNLQSSRNIQIPLEIIDSTMRLIQTNPKMPLDSENVKTWFWSIPSPKKKRNILMKLINHVGFSRNNIVSYIICYILILITYGLWITKPNADIFTLINEIIYNPVELSMALFTTIFALIVLILPIISLGYTETDILQASRKDFFLRIEPTIFVMTLILNYIIFRFGGPLPILIIPGEPKVKGAPPLEHIVKSIKRSIYPSLILVLGSFSVFMAIKILKYNVNSFILLNIQLMALFGLTILILELMPFGNALGKILLRNKPVLFYFSLTLVTMLLMTVITID